MEATKKTFKFESETRYSNKSGKFLGKMMDAIGEKYLHDTCKILLQMDKASFERMHEMNCEEDYKAYWLVCSDFSLITDNADEASEAAQDFPDFRIFVSISYKADVGRFDILLKKQDKDTRLEHEKERRSYQRFNPVLSRKCMLESGRLIEFDVNHPIYIVKHWDAGQWHLDEAFPATEDGRRMATQYMDKSYWHEMSLKYYS